MRNDWDIVWDKLVYDDWCLLGSGYNSGSTQVHGDATGVSRICLHVLWGRVCGQGPAVSQRPVAGCQQSGDPDLQERSCGSHTEIFIWNVCKQWYPPPWKDRSLSWLNQCIYNTIVIFFSITTKHSELLCTIVIIRGVLPPAPILCCLHTVYVFL